MSTIDVKTSHNIRIDLDLADPFIRVLAFIIDIIVIVLYLSIFSSLSLPKEFFYILFLPVLLFYNLICEIFMNGQTIGKKLLKLRVVSLDGKDVSLESTFIRWSFRLVDILIGFGSIAFLSIYGSRKNQRLGDLLAGTTVIKIQKEHRFTLKSLEELNTLERNITYPQVARYSDSDMLFVKKLLNRFRSDRNTSNTKVLQDTAKKFKNDLNIQGKVNAPEFLQTILEDYIILTRE